MAKKINRNIAGPKRLRQAAESSAQRGMFFADRNRNGKQTDFSPQYMTVANDIIKRIFEGEYRPASKLPSMRDLAKKYGVSVQVILSAFQGLQSLNYVKSYPKKGVYVSADIRPARFYRIAVFVLNQNPMSYGGILYHLNTALEESGYCTIIGMNFDGNLSLRHWLSFKRNLDGLIILGTLTDKQDAQFKRIRIPYMMVASQIEKRVNPDYEAELNAFAKWFVDDYIDHPPESRPVYYFRGSDRTEEDLPSISKEWDFYQAEQIYAYGKNGKIRKF